LTDDHTSLFLWWQDGQVPKVARARVLLEFADGRTAEFEAAEPWEVKIQMHRRRYDPLLGQDIPAVPEVIEPLASLSDITGVTMSMKVAPRDNRRISYTYSPNRPEADHG
jgi:hypothetical protein